MFSRIVCPGCDGPGCDLCRVGPQVGYVEAGWPNVPLPWFLDLRNARWPMVVAELLELQAEADAQGRELAVFDRWHRTRSIAQIIADDKGNIHPDTERWSARKGLIWNNAGSELQPEFNLRDYTAQRRAGATPVGDVIEVEHAPADDADLGKPSREVPGLYLRRHGAALIFTWKPTGYWEAWDARTGQQIGAHDRGTWPASAAAYVKAKVQEILPPHRRLAAVPAHPPAREETALTANQRAASSEVPVNPEALKGAPAAPIVSVPDLSVKKENEPMLDLSNPTVVAAARTVATNIKNALGLPALEGRRDDLRKRSFEVEKTYRLAEVDVEQARRELSTAAAAIKDREAELIDEAAALKGEDGKKRYTSADAAKAAAVGMRKTDAEHQALTSAHAAAEQKLYEAERKFAEAKAAQRALVREHELLREELRVVAARIDAFAGLDAPAPAAGPAPVNVPTPQPSAA